MTAQRTIRDGSLTVTKALPAAGANVDTASFDLGAAGAGILEKIELEVTFPLTTTLVDGKVATMTVQDSADDSTFAAVEECATFTVTGGTGNGNAETIRKYRLPSTCKRYVNVNTSIPGDGGNNTAKSLTVRILT